MVLLAWGARTGPTPTASCPLGRGRGPRSRRASAAGDATEDRDASRSRSSGPPRRRRPQAHPGERRVAARAAPDRRPAHRALRARGDAPRDRARRRSAATPSTASRASARRPTPPTCRRMAGRSSSATACSGSIREEQAVRDELRFWDATVPRGRDGAVARAAPRLLDALAGPLGGRPRARSRPDEAAPDALGVAYATNAPAAARASRSATPSRGASPRRPRRRSGTGRR